jgi:hypothetical protein
VYYGRVIGNMAGYPSTNIFAWESLTPPSPGTADVALANDVCVGLSSAWATFVLAMMPAEYTFTETQVYPLHTPLNPAVIVTSSVVGGRTAGAAPMLVGALVHHTTTRRGKGSQSRTTLSPILETGINTDHRTLLGIYQADLQTHFDTFKSDVAAAVLASSSHVISHVQVSKGTSHISPAAFPITLSSVESEITTQRRRMRR